MKFWKRIKAFWALAPIIEGVSRVVVLDGDTLVIEYPYQLSNQARINWSDAMRACGFPRVLILEGGTHLRAVLGRYAPPTG